MTFQVAQGGSRSAESRLLLPNASTVTVVVRDAASNLVTSQVYPLAGKTSVTASFSLEVLKTYTVYATARSAAPAETLLYAGSTTVTLTKSLSGVLYLLPVDSNGDVLWPVVTPGPAATVPSLSLVSSNSSTFRITFGPDATGFTLAPTPAGLDAYVQTLPNGTPVAGPPALLSKAALGNDVLVTYFASGGDQTLASLGSFVVPVQSFSLSGPSNILVNDIATATLQSLTPTYTSDSQASDYTWSASGAVTLEPTPGQVKGKNIGHATVTASSKSAGVTAQWDFEVTNPPLANIDAVPQYSQNSTVTFTGTADSGAGGPGIQDVWIIRDTTGATIHDTETPSVPLGWTKTSTAVSNPTSQSTWTVLLGGFPEGTSRVWAKAVDNNGTVSAAASTADVFVDTIDPTLSEVGPASFATATGFGFSGTAIDGGSGVASLTVDVDGPTGTPVTISTGAWSYSVASASVGVHSYDFTLTDFAGRSTKILRSVTVNGAVANPTFSVAAGTYTSTQSVTITSSTPGASIRYTTDGSTPTSSVGTVYSGAVTVSASQTLKAIAYLTNWLDSGVSSAAYTITGTVANPAFSVAAGVYTSTQSVTITSSTPGASIRYTTDGSTPTSSVGTVYSGAVTVSASQTLKAIAYLTNWTDSSVSSAAYTITGTVANPAFSVVAGVYTSTQSVTITSSTPGASIRYTTDGSTPTSSVGTVYSGAVTVSASQTLKAIAYLTNWLDSGVSSAAYTITGTVANPAFSVAAGVYTSTQSVTITSSTPGVSIRYTTDGSTPTSSVGTVYSGAVTVSASQTLKAIAYLTNWLDSGVSSAAYTITGTVANPTFSVAAGVYTSTQSVTITSSTPGASIRYTTDGSTPTSSVGTVYSGAVTVSASQTLKAIAYLTNWLDSGVSSAAYTITGTVANPTFSVAAGVYTSTQSVTITSSTPGASIRYTTDGSTPTSSVGTVYSGAVTVSASQTLKAIAYLTNWTDSSVTSAAYTITSTVDLTFQVIGYQTLGFSAGSLVLVDGDTLIVTPGNVTLQTSGTSWQWKLDGNLVPGSTGTKSFTSLSVGLHTLFVSVDYDGIVYSGSIPITVNPVEAF